MNREISRKMLFPAGAFSLLEMLVAMAVLSLMMVFLFNLVAQTMRAWESGARQIEAAQAARIGLDTMARELQTAFGGQGVMSDSLTPGALVTNTIPFFATNQGTTLWGLPSPAFTVAPNSGQLFAVAPLSGESNAFGELGYMSVYVTQQSAGKPGYHNLRGYRYYLIRHSPPLTNGTDIFYRGNPNTNWMASQAVGGGVSVGHRIALIPNCYQIGFAFASNGNGVLSWSTNWASQTNMPAGVLITAKVMDEKTAARIASLQSNGLTAADVTNGSATTIGRILREGTVEFHRFVPFVNARR